MQLTLTEERKQAHVLLDLLLPEKLGVVRSLLEVMIGDEDEELSAEDCAAIRASREFFRDGGEGLSLEQVAADCGFTMDQILTAQNE